MIWWGRQRAAFNAEAVGCTNGFAMFCQKTAPNIEMIRCIDEFSRFYQWDCIQRWNDWMHWRIDNVLSKNCTWHWNGQMHWRIDDFCQKTAFNVETIECINEFFFFTCYQVEGCKLLTMPMTWIGNVDYTSSRSISADWHSIDWSMCCQKNCIHV